MMMMMRQRMAHSFLALTARSPFRRTIYMGTMNRAVVDFVPVRKENKPFILRREGIKDRWFRILQAARRSVGYEGEGGVVSAIELLLLEVSNLRRGP